MDILIFIYERSGIDNIAELTYPNDNSLKEVKEKLFIGIKGSNQKKNPIETLSSHNTFQNIQQKHFPFITKSKLLTCFRNRRNKKARTKLSY